LWLFLSFQDIQKCKGYRNSNTVLWVVTPCSQVEVKHRILEDRLAHVHRLTETANITCPSFIVTHNALDVNNLCYKVVDWISPVSNWCYWRDFLNTVMKWRFYKWRVLLLRSWGPVIVSWFCSVESGDRLNLNSCEVESIRILSDSYWAYPHTDPIHMLSDTYWVYPLIEWLMLTLSACRMTHNESIRILNDSYWVYELHTHLHLTEITRWNCGSFQQNWCLLWKRGASRKARIFSGL
jgi:hypothetical protein